MEFFFIIFYFLLIIFINIYSYKKSLNDISSYTLGTRSLNFISTALSVFSSDLSGWLLMGFPGMVYLIGIKSIWIILGLIIGSFLNYSIIAPRFSTYTKILNSFTFSDYLKNRFEYNFLSTLSSIIIFIFFSIYVSSGIIAGGKLLYSAFQIRYKFGLVIISIIIALYTFFGGFLSISSIDVIQGLTVLLSLMIITFVSMHQLGGFYNIFQSIPKNKLIFFKKKYISYIISLLSWGLGYFGQPHILTRFMAIRSIKDLKKSRNLGIFSMIISMLSSMIIGLISISYFKTNKKKINTESIFIILNRKLFNPIFIGLFLSCMIVAIINSTSSQVLVNSNNLLKGIYENFFFKKSECKKKNDKKLLNIGRILVLFSTLFSLILSFFLKKNILDVVSYAWAGFGSSFGPIVLYSLYFKNINFYGAISGIISGTLTVLIWIFLPISKKIYAIIPGFIVSSFSIFLITFLTEKFIKNDNLINNFIKFEKEFNKKK
ncbi:sodium:solute symporter family transporter [Candidatus Shikimatogenerans silvanidophilus]|uniref:sodium:solute symporter family transporter n=1 Tax=Candidatus Shikimatogenerans silvanidophilus TaxID=2782547 RepID=UPI001BA4B9EC|nr:sodium/solute symporter [Candidatus Shikimatogenerans silvanidophilus]